MVRKARLDWAFIRHRIFGHWLYFWPWFSWWEGCRWDTGNPWATFYFHPNKSYHQTSSFPVSAWKRFFARHPRTPLPSAKKISPTGVNSAFKDSTTTSAASQPLTCVESDIMQLLCPLSPSYTHRPPSPGQVCTPSPFQFAPPPSRVPVLFVMVLPESDYRLTAYSWHLSWLTPCTSTAGDHLYRIFKPCEHVTAQIHSFTW